MDNEDTDTWSLLMYLAGESKSLRNGSLDDITKELFGCSYQSFSKITKTLIHLIEVAEGEEDGKIRHGFADRSKSTFLICVDSPY